MNSGLPVSGSGGGADGKPALQEFYRGREAAKISACAPPPQHTWSFTLCWAARDCKSEIAHYVAAFVDTGATGGTNFARCLK